MDKGKDISFRELVSLFTSFIIGLGAVSLTVVLIMMISLALRDM